VRFGDAVGDLNGELHGPAHVQRAPGHLGAERLPLHELEYQEHAAFVLARLVKRRDVRMRQCDDRPRTLQEPRAFGGVAGKALRQQAHGDRSSGAGIARAKQVAGS
jgi:hypothetical protein